MADGSHAHSDKPEHQSFWLWIMCLTGVDYFSTLSYQPSIAFQSTGRLAPLATVLLILMTLFGALPVYRYVAGKSPHGQGSIAMLEELVPGWWGKLCVLLLLGFAGTDFVITKTLSAADAAEHLISNPNWPWKPGNIDARSKQQMFVTIGLLVLLAALFMRGFTEVIGLAVVIVGVYLVLNLIVIGSGLIYLVQHPDRLTSWLEFLERGPPHWLVEDNPFDTGGVLTIIVLCFLFFPKLALGLSGFETGVAVMPLVRGRDDDDPQAPRQRIRNTRKLLTVAAVIMSLFLLSSSLVVTTLISPEELLDVHHLGTKPAAADRAMSFLAHGESSTPISPLFGNVFGTIYDLATVAILSFAGASAMAGLLNLVPRYLPEYGMAPAWATAIKPLVILFTLINLLVTWAFDASVTAQGGAYATGVLVLMSSACVATVIGHYRQREGRWFVRMPWHYFFIMLIFFYTTTAVIIEKPDGIKIATFFLIAILSSSLLSRIVRSSELRFAGFDFVDDESRFLWQSMEALEFPVLVPHRTGHVSLADKEARIRSDHRLTDDVPLVFIEAERGDPSVFLIKPRLEVKQEEGRFILRVDHCPSIAHVLAHIALELAKHGKPPEIHFGWSHGNALKLSFDFLFFGEGNIPQLVHELIEKQEPDHDKRPKVIVG